MNLYDYAVAVIDLDFGDEGILKYVYPAYRKSCVHTGSEMHWSPLGRFGRFASWHRLGWCKAYQDHAKLFIAHNQKHAQCGAAPHCAFWRMP